jgi:hypothetical protein
MESSSDRLAGFSDEFFYVGPLGADTDPQIADDRLYEFALSGAIETMTDDHYQSFLIDMTYHAKKRIRRFDKRGNEIAGKFRLTEDTRYIHPVHKGERCYEAVA